MFTIFGKILTLGYLPLSADGPDVLAVHVALLDVHGLDELHGGGDAAAALSLNLRHQLRPCGKWNRKLNGEAVESSCPILFDLFIVSRISDRSDSEPRYSSDDEKSVFNKYVTNLI